MKNIIFFLGCILLCVSCKKDLIADFEVSGTTKVGETISFINHSSPAGKYSWDFGDGSSSSEESPTYKYIKPGNYSVNLKVTGAHGSASVNKAITITGTTYIFHNSTSFDLSNFCSFYWDGANILDFTQHGLLERTQETRIVITTRSEIMFAFRYGDVFYTSAVAFLLLPDFQNVLTITDNTPINGGKGTTDIIEHLKYKFSNSK
jgi:PKD repeat protein